MRYRPDAAERTDTLPIGQYEAVVKRAEEKTSKAGDPMIEVILTVYGAAGKETDVFDYLLSLDDWQWKVKHFCESAGIDYARGELTDEQCFGKNVRVDLKVEKKEGYRERNAVKDYLPRSGVAVTSVNREPQDADIPF
jgi:hypothetical protein